MKLTILSCGPSLKMYNPREDDADEVIAINRAAEAYPHDWWAFMDADTILFEGKPAKGVITSKIIHGKIMHNPALKDLWQPKWEWVHVPRLRGWPGFTFIAAFMTAVKTWNPDEIHVYGVDMVGQEDFTGSTQDVRWDNTDRKRRDERKRWPTERTAVEELFSTHNVIHHKGGA